ncbi:conserved hypothetical protein [Vibrio chagasii]|nr:conserved hypothetical protein [Vibrio chagasii]
MVKCAHEEEVRRKYGISRAKCGVGKLIGGDYYVHKDFATASNIPDLHLAIAVLPYSWEYEVVVYSKKLRRISFVQSPDWHTSHEPLAGGRMHVTISNGVASIPVESKSRGQIYHHKWLWVMDDYQGFDVQESIERSLSWLKEKSKSNEKISGKIGRPEFWDAWLKSNGLSGRNPNLKS